MSWRPQINEKGVIACWRNTDTGEVLTPKQYEQRIVMQGSMSAPMEGAGVGLQTSPYQSAYPAVPSNDGVAPVMVSPNGQYPPMQSYPAAAPMQGYPSPYAAPAPLAAPPATSPLVQQGATPVNALNQGALNQGTLSPLAAPGASPPSAAAG